MLLLLLLSVVVGGGGMVGQLLLLRELLVSFHGNELIMGVILANWLLLEAAGALAAGRKAANTQHPLKLYLLLLFLYAVLLPASLFYSRGAQYIFFSPLPGEGVGAASIFLATLLLMAPPAFTHGALFPLGCRLLSPLLGEEVSISKIYLYETLGTLAGGTLFTLYLAERYHSLELALGVALLHLSGCFFLLVFFPRSEQQKGRATQPFQGSLLSAVTLAAALMLLLFFGPAAAYLHNHSLERQWGGREVVQYTNTPYGNIVVLHSRGEYTIFYDGRPIITIPAPDRALIGDFVHITAAAHPQPQRVLCLAGGPGGFLEELLKHPVEEVVYVDLDPHLPEVLSGLATPLMQRELFDPRVTVRSLDGRLFLEQTGKDFDLIMLGGFVTPETLQTNRLFTGEFFSLAGRRLREGGVLAFSAPGSPVFMSPEMLSLNASLYQTLQEHFTHVYVSPGETNIFLASRAPLNITPDLMNERLKTRGLGGEFVAGSYLDYRLDSERKRSIVDSLGAAEVRRNRDLNPAAFYYTLGHWGEAFSPETLQLMNMLELLTLHHYLLAILLVTAVIMIACRRKGSGQLRFRQPAALSWAVFTSGAAGMSLDLLVLFVFQCLYGFVYQMAGLLVASFMAGNYLGGLWGLGRSGTSRQGKAFVFLDLGVFALLIFFYPFTLALQFLAGHIPGTVIFILVAIFALCGGFVVGAQFPLAAHLFTRGKEKGGDVAGILYGADLFGGWAAGLIVSIVLFPLLGLWQTLLILGLLKLGSFALLRICETDEVGQQKRWV